MAAATQKSSPLLLSRLLRAASAAALVRAPRAPWQMAGPEYLDEDEEAEDPPPTAEGDDGEDDSSKDEKSAPEDGGDEHQTKRLACLARLGAL